MMGLLATFLTLMVGLTTYPNVENTKVHIKAKGIVAAQEEVISPKPSTTISVTPSVSPTPSIDDEKHDDQIEKVIRVEAVNNRSGKTMPVSVPAVAVQNSQALDLKTSVSPTPTNEEVEVEAELEIEVKKSEKNKAEENSQKEFGHSRGKDK